VLYGNALALLVARHCDGSATGYRKFRSDARESLADLVKVLAACSKELNRLRKYEDQQKRDQQGQDPANEKHGTPAPDGNHCRARKAADYSAKRHANE